MDTGVAAELVELLRDRDGVDLRVVLAYEGDDYETVLVHDEVAEQFTDEQFDELAKRFVLKSLDDWVEQPEFATYGHLDVVTRWFHEIVVVQVPVGEWSGVLLSFERTDVEAVGEAIEEILDYVDEPDHGLREEEFDEETVAEAAEEHFDD